MLAADVTRYICEVTELGNKLKGLKENALKLYERSDRKSENLHYASSVKLSRDMHHANFVHEFMNDTSLALKMCEAAVLKAQATINQVDEDAYVEATHLMELLKENCAIWRG